MTNHELIQKLQSQYANNRVMVKVPDGLALTRYFDVTSVDEWTGILTSRITVISIGKEVG